MRYLDEFRNKKLVLRAAEKIKRLMPDRELKFMEVCGTHTQSFHRFSLKKLLPEKLQLISGPGCPICVSSQAYIDTAIRLSCEKGVLVLSFGDMLRVPGTRSSLEYERGRGANVRVVYSPLDALRTARDNPDKQVIFLAVGFETTAPAIALSILSAQKQKISNLYFLSSLKTMPAAMGHLLKDKRINLQGFLCPGHVSAIIGQKAYDFIPKKYLIGCCIAGFEPLDILEGIYLLIKQIARNKPKVDNQYMRVVKSRGNLKAQSIIRQVFTADDASWRGLGKIAQSGLRIRKEFAGFDAERIFKIGHQVTRSPGHQARGCRCGDVLKGLIIPRECRLFAKACTPEKPVGACMVSMEGACNAYYRYSK